MIVLTEVQAISGTINCPDFLVTAVADDGVRFF
jgi:hypothetical protein